MQRFCLIANKRYLRLWDKLRQILKKGRIHVYLKHETQNISSPKVNIILSVAQH